MADPNVITLAHLAQLEVAEFRSLTILENIGRVLSLDLSPADSIKPIRRELLARSSVGRREDDKISAMLEEFATFLLPLTEDKHLPPIAVINDIQKERLMIRAKEKLKTCDQCIAKLDEIADILIDSDYQDTQRITAIQNILISRDK